MGAKIDLFPNPVESLPLNTKKYIDLHCNNVLTVAIICSFFLYSPDTTHALYFMHLFMGLVCTCTCTCTFYQCVKKCVEK